MQAIIIKNAHLVDGSVIDIRIQDENIQEIGQNLDATDALLLHVPEDVYVSGGWIDLHTHCFTKYTLYGDDADEVGYKQGVTTVVDAGTAGCDTIDEFYQQAKQAKTNVVAFLNIARQGISAQNELADIENLDMEALHQAILTYPDFIVGLKARMSRSVLQGNGNIPLDIAIAQAKKEDLPVMVHVGNEPATLEDVMCHVRAGDIVTHIFNPKKNGILDEQGNLKSFVLEAHDKGTYFDLGHGSESFSFTTCQKAHQQGLHCDSISTDIYFHNRQEGPVYSLALTMSKLYHLGYSLQEVIDKVTIVPAKILRRNDLGRIAVGGKANLTFFQLKNCSLNAVDSLGKEEILSTYITPCAVMVNGAYYELQEEVSYGKYI